MMMVPWESNIVTSVLVNKTEHSASQKIPMLSRLLIKSGMMVPVVVPGGSCGKLMVAVADECSTCPLAILMFVGGEL